MGEEERSGSGARFCEEAKGFACALAQAGGPCGIEAYLGEIAPRIRPALRARLLRAAQNPPDGSERLERRCAERLHGGKVVVGVMGPGAGATPRDEENAFALGQLIARQGWVLLTGGRPEGVMAAATRGAKSAGGLTVGILPSRTTTPANTAADVDIRIVTGMNDARNAINVLSSDVVVACGMGAGTASEVALALKAGKPVILLGGDREATAFFGRVGKDRPWSASTAHEAFGAARDLLTAQIRREATRHRGGPSGEQSTSGHTTQERSAGGGVREESRRTQDPHPSR